MEWSVKKLRQAFPLPSYNHEIKTYHLFAPYTCFSVNIKYLPFASNNLLSISKLL